MSDTARTALPQTTISLARTNNVDLLMGDSPSSVNHVMARVRTPSQMSKFVGRSKTATAARMSEARRLPRLPLSCRGSCLLDLASWRRSQGQ